MIYIRKTVLGAMMILLIMMMGLLKENHIKKLMMLKLKQFLKKEINYLLNRNINLCKNNGKLIEGRSTEPQSGTMKV